MINIDLDMFFVGNEGFCKDNSLNKICRGVI